MEIVAGDHLVLSASHECPSAVLFGQYVHDLVMNGIIVLSFVQ